MNRLHYIKALYVLFYNRMNKMFIYLVPGQAGAEWLIILQVIIRSTFTAIGPLTLTGADCNCTVLNYC